eukprot:4535441-Amphidinium_carterae.1
MLSTQNLSNEQGAPELVVYGEVDETSRRLQRVASVAFTGDTCCTGLLPGVVLKTVVHTSYLGCQGIHHFVMSQASGVHSGLETQDSSSHSSDSHDGAVVFCLAFSTSKS